MMLTPLRNVGRLLSLVSLPISIRALARLVVVALFSWFGSGAASALGTSSPTDGISQTYLSDTPGQQATLIVGSEQEYPPFSTGMADDTAGGFTVDLWKAVAAESGLSYRIRVLPFHLLLQEFKAGKIDVLLNLAQSDERRKLADFTVPHVVINGAIFVRKDQTGIMVANDLADKSIIVINTDLAQDYARSKGWAKQLVLVDTAADGLRLLSSGKHDAMLLSKLTGLQTLQALGLTNVEVHKEKAGFSQKFAFATHPGATELLAKLNEGLALTKANGIYDTLYEKSFGVYDAKNMGWRDLLTYLAPVFILLSLIAGYFFYRWQVERHRVLTAVAESRNFLLTVINSTPTRIFWKDFDLRFLGCNAAFASDAGMTHPEDLIGKDDHQLWWVTHAEAYRADDREVMASGVAKLSYDEQQTTPMGQTIWLRTSKVPLRNTKNEIIGLLGVYDDITQRKLLEEQVRQLAFHDALTGLPNRRMLADRLSQTRLASQRNGQCAALILLDLDNFKSLNDTRGHEAGDLLLLEVAGRLQSCVRAIDTVARLGGDEFVLLLSDLNEEQTTSMAQAALVAEKVRFKLSQPYLITSVAGTIEHHCTASIGVTVFVGDQLSQDEILKCADKAMYLAKGKGRNQVHFCDLNN